MKKEDIDKQLSFVEKEGKMISPMLPKSIKNYLIDIDGTICDDVPNEEPERMLTVEPYEDALKTINNWYDEGHRITFFTSRIEEFRDLTEKWLKNSGFKYHDIIMGKPRGGNYHWIDSRKVRSTRYKGKFTDMVKKELTIEVFKS
ncbi:MAG: phosphoheptose isomerase [Flavobacteriales bacterium]|nr:phosphoheptose isomerase [Flavobacteriales bacterium]